MGNPLVDSSADEKAEMMVDMLGSDLVGKKVVVMEMMKVDRMERMLAEQMVV